jgi:hypothetical protein
VGGGQPLPYDLANYRGQYDSGPSSQFQAAAGDNPYLYIPLGPKVPFEEALSAIQKYVQWQESSYEEKIQKPKDLQVSLGELSDAFNAAISDAVTAQGELQKLLDQRAADSVPGVDPYFIKNKYDADIAAAEARRDTAEKARVQAQRNYEGVGDDIQANRARQLEIDVEGPPGKDAKKSKAKGDKYAQDLGVGLVEGVLQGLGFGDVFGDFITEWGIFKKGMGLLDFGMGVAQNAGLLPKPGTGAAAANSGLGPGTAQGVVSGAFQAAVPGLSSIPGVQSTAGANVPVVSPASSVTPAMTPTAAPDPLTQTGGTGPAPGPMVQVTNYNNGLATQAAFDYNVGSAVARHGANALAGAMP